MKRVLLVVAVAAAVAPSAADPASRGRQYPWFHLASRAVYCHVDVSDRRFPLLCWRPVSGYVVAMAPKGKVQTATLRRWRKNWEDSSPILRKGKSWRYPGFRCTVATSGRQIKCVNQRNHGWTLGPGKAKRVF